MRRHSEKGFSLIEVVVVITVIAFVSIIAIPSLPGMISNRRAAFAADDLFSSFIYARSEAIRLNQPVTIQAIDGDWSNGWEVLDPNNAGAVLVRHTMDSLSVEDVSGAVAVTYAPSGRLPPGVMPRLLVCDAVKRAKVRQVTIDPSGMPNILVGDTCI